MRTGLVNFLTDLDFDMAIFRGLAVVLVLLACSCVTSPQVNFPQLYAKELSSNSQATVLFWWATQCPCVARYRSRIEELKERYLDKGISFIAISSNSDDEDRIPDAPTQRPSALPILKDAGGHLAKQLGVTTTPTVILLSQSGDVLFKGWIDNERAVGDSGRIPYLENAITDFLEFSKVSSPSSPTYGCRITKRLL